MVSARLLYSFWRSMFCI